MTATVICQPPKGDGVSIVETLIPDDMTIWEYIRKQLDRIADYPVDDPAYERLLVAEKVAEYANDILHQLCDKSTVFPAIAGDGENGISIVWCVGKYMLHVQVHDDLDVIVALRTPETKLTVRPWSKCKISELKAHVLTFSVNLQKSKPNWRKLVLVP